MSATADEKPPLRFHDDENPSMTRLFDHLAFGNKEEKMIRKTDEKSADVEQIQSKIPMRGHKKLCIMMKKIHLCKDFGITLRLDHL